MAKVTLTLSVDTSAASDIARELAKIHAELASRHGEKYRQFERRLEAAIEVIQPSDIDVVMVEGCLIASAPRQFAAVMQEARALGLTCL